MAIRDLPEDLPSVRAAVIDTDRLLDVLREEVRHLNRLVVALAAREEALSYRVRDLERAPGRRRWWQRSR